MHQQRVEQFSIRKGNDLLLAAELDLEGNLFTPGPHIEGIAELLSESPDGDHVDGGIAGS
jgi:hypothetical protein